MFDTGEVNEHPGLAALDERFRPTLLRAEQRVEVDDALSALFPLGGPSRGSSVSVDGVGATSLVMSIVATPTRRGEWVALVGVDHWGWSAAVAAGVDPRQTIAVGQPEPRRWSSVMGALVDAFAIVVVDASRPVAAADIRRLDARCREHGTVVLRLTPVGGRSRWPSSADVALSVADPRWEGAGEGYGHLSSRVVTVRAGGRRRGSQRAVSMMLPSSVGAVEIVDTPDIGVAPAVSDARRLRRVV